ncbi:hypothetical protein PHSY_000318 [Pseudozyma hubeiensis SY62]|uniref:Uncharacterized protein n=1 Tax=Pseudozyma hubeiensis (strain SY62) TaxID=1305764 RepID=R9NWC1_PSEHS|nr:hypothetical protein PHSY_000318 [Pseudozyma hubeiensis SY62]GAC92762.1 hypothetical protein PHSY_000318 [Pseudozyma hubeiensis SY62]
MPQETPASCLLFVRICQLAIRGKDVADLIHRLQSLSLEYQQATGGRAIEDDALKAILINQVFGIAEYHIVIRAMGERGELTDYYSVAAALQSKWEAIR